MKAGALSGSAILTVKSAGPRASYDWQMSVDGGKTWTEIPSTTKAKTNVAALAVGTSVQFRFRTLTPKGQSDWSQPTGLARIQTGSVATMTDTVEVATDPARIVTGTAGVTTGAARIFTGTAGVATGPGRIVAGMARVTSGPGRVVAGTAGVTIGPAEEETGPARTSINPVGAGAGEAHVRAAKTLPLRVILSLLRA